MRDLLVHRLLPILICVAVVLALRYWDVGVAGLGLQSTTVAMGLLLVGAFVGGQLSAAVRLPRITGYLLTGLLLGPYATGLLTKDMLGAGYVVEGIAVALIALMAGGEIRLDWIRSQLKRLLLITGFELLIVGLVVFALVIALRDVFPFMPSGDAELGRALVIAMIFGVLATANSPTVTIAVIAETRADGPVARTVLGVTVTKDVVIIVLFAAAMAFARATLDPDSAQASLGWVLTRELGGSILAGLVFGAILSWYLLKIRRDAGVVVLFVCFAISELSAALHLEALLVALTAGLWVENFSKADGHALIQGIESVSLPVLALFFAAAGAKMDLVAFAETWHLALLLIVVRAVAIWGGVRIGATLSGAEPSVRRYAWTGFISQAGVTLALSAIVVRAFPTWGAEIQVLVIAMIAVHELIGPIGFQQGLARAGEIGRAALPSRDAGGPERRH